MLDLDATVLAAASAAFGELVTWSPPDYPAGLSVPAIFWDAARDLNMKDGVEVEQIVTLLSVRTASFPRQPRQHDPVIVRGVRYVVTDVMPDGAGAAKIRIRFAADSQAAVTPLAPVPVAS